MITINLSRWQGILVFYYQYVIFAVAPPFFKGKVGAESVGIGLRAQCAE